MSGFEWLYGGCKCLRVPTSGVVRLWGGYKWLGLATSGLKSIHQFSLSLQAVCFGRSYDSFKIHAYKKSWSYRTKNSGCCRHFKRNFKITAFLSFQDEPS